MIKYVTHLGRLAGGRGAPYLMCSPLHCCIKMRTSQALCLAGAAVAGCTMRSHRSEARHGELPRGLGPKVVTVLGTQSHPWLQQAKHALRFRGGMSSGVHRIPPWHPPHESHTMLWGSAGTGWAVLLGATVLPRSCAALQPHRLSAPRAHLRPT